MMLNQGYQCLKDDLDKSQTNNKVQRILQNKQMKAMQSQYNDGKCGNHILNCF